MSVGDAMTNEHHHLLRRVALAPLFGLQHPLHHARQLLLFAELAQGAHRRRADGRVLVDGGLQNIRQRLAGTALGKNLDQFDPQHRRGVVHLGGDAG